jgi:PleD family two-component response regulator
MKNHRFLHSESPASLSLMHEEGLRESNPIEIPLVLIIDSNENYRNVLKQKLKKFYRVHEADNGRDGWRKTVSCHPNLVITDIDAPVVDGFEFCKKARADRRTSHIPVILLTNGLNDNNQIESL